MQTLIRRLFLGLLIVLGAGCESTRWNWFKPNNDNSAKPGATPSVANLVTYLNNNAERIQSLRVEDLSIDATMGNQSIGLQGRIFAEKPRNFRMKVTAFGKDEVDIGSNQQEFWFWAAKNPDPYQYFCSYNDFQSGRVRRMPLPIQPEWVMEAMGLGPYGPADRYKLEQDGQIVKLVEHITTPAGQKVRKVIVINRREVRSPEPQVKGYLLLDDATGQEICAASITSTTVDRKTGAIVPYRMELRMPTQKMRMSLKMDGLTTNAPTSGTPFVRQPMTNIEPFNLATERIEPFGFQRTEGSGMRP